MHGRYKIIFFCAALFFVFIVSCKQNETDNTGFVSNSYKQVLKVGEQKFQTEPLPKVTGYIDSAYAAMNGGSAEAKMNKYSFFCNIYANEMHDYFKAHNYADSMLQLLSKSTDKKFENEYRLTACYSMGDAYYGLKKYNDAFRYYYKAKAIAASTVDSFALQDYNYRLGMMMYKQQRFEDANEYFKTSLRQINYRELNFDTFIRKQELISNIGLSFFKLGLYDSALRYYNSGLEYLETNNSVVGKRNLIAVAKGVIYGNMAHVFIARKQFDMAEQLLKKSVSINSQKGYDNRDAQFAKITLGNLYLAKNETEKACPLIKELKTNLDSITNEEAVLRLYELSYKYYEQVGDPQKALRSFEGYLQMKDSMTHKNKDFLATDVDELLGSIEAQHKIELLQKNNEVQRVFTLVAVIIIMMVLSIIFLVYKNYRKSNKHVTALTGLNEKLTEEEAKLTQALAKLEKESKSKDHILKIVAHDLRNPLHGIAGITSIVSKEDGITKHQKHLLSLVQASCEDAHQLINEILEVAGLAEVKKLARKPTDINEMLTKTVELLQNKALEKKQQIVLDIAKKPEELFINREKITRVISNLINNSIKFSPANEEIYVSTAQNKSGMIISIKDKGIGIPAELAECVFDTFTPAKRPGTFGEKSFGLGLSICRQIVEAHNGKIWFESEPGKGTTFHVQLN